MITMTTPRALGQAVKLRVVRAWPHEDVGEADVDVQLLNAPNIIVCTKRLTIRNGTSDGLDYNLAPVAGQGIDSALILSPNVRITPTGYDDATTAWRTGSTSAARLTALEGYLLTSGIFGPTLAGVAAVI